MTTDLLNPIRVDEVRLREFNTLMEGTYRKVYDMAYRLSGSRPDAEDLTQEAYFRAYRSFDTYEGSRPFENWIYRIVTRVFLDLLRTRRRRVEVVSYDAPLPNHHGEPIYVDAADKRLGPEDQLMAGVLSEDLLRALSLLGKKQRRLVWLADVEQKPYDDIASEFGTPVGTIRSRLHRTHKLLRRGLEQHPNAAGV
jgi:RNA polymerase sigma-70 factor (ECF subfamily)